MSHKHRQRVESQWPYALFGGLYLLGIIFAVITAIVALVKLTIWIWSI